MISHPHLDISRLEVEETAPSVATRIHLSLRETCGYLFSAKNHMTQLENHENCNYSLAYSQNDLKDATSEIQKWHSEFENESFIPKENLLETAKRKEASYIVQYEKREQENAELKATVQRLRVQLKPASMQARRLLLDPTIHEEFTRFKNLVEEKDKKLNELQDSIAALSFTQESKMVQMLMTKCKSLHKENDEIGHQTAEAEEKIPKLLMKLASQKAQNTKLKGQFKGLFKRIDALTNDLERSNETTIILQDTLEANELEVQKLKRKMQEKSVC